MSKTKLFEASRNQLLNKSRNADVVKSYGTTRYARRNVVHTFNTTKSYNRIDNNALFRADLLSFIIPVHGETDDYEVEVLFDGIATNIQRQVKLNNNKLEYKCIYRAIIDAINKSDVYVGCSCPDYCLKGDTEIKLLNGQVYTIDQLLEKFRSGEDLWVYSTDENGDFKPGHISDIWISGYSNDMIKVTLDNGCEIITTPNHRYMLRDGSYIEAEKLKCGQSLMPLYFRDTNGYENVKYNRRSGDPHWDKVFNSFDEMLNYFNLSSYNHKIIEIEHIHYDNPIPVYDLTVDKWNNFYVNAGVILHNCYRFQYWASKGRYNSMAPQLVPANTTNPNNSKGTGCKHILSVLANLEWAMNLATSIYNYTVFMEQNYPDKYYRVMFPAIYGMSYERAQDLGILDDEELANTMDNPEDVQDIDQANEQGGSHEGEIPEDDIEPEFEDEEEL